MSQGTWGSATAKQAGGEGDPNVLKLKDANRVRLLDPTGPRRWRQHFIESSTDPEQGRSIVCPRGDGGGTCPLCMKPVDAEGNQRFSMSRRFATNVWDYETQSVKILIGGPQIFEEFDAVAAVGMDPMASDFLIHKMGQNKNTSYKVMRGDSAPLSVQITPEMLHDLDKFDTPTPVEQIFEKLEEMGIDYDSLETPSFSLAEAEAFVMPFGKYKGMTMEALVANDDDYAQFMHNKMKEGGSLGDPVFIAFQVVLEDRGLVEPMADVPTAAPRPAGAAPAPSGATESASPAQDAGKVTLVGPDGTEVTVDASAADALRGAGYTDPTPPEPEALAEVTLYGPDGTLTTVPAAAADGLRGAGFTDEPPQAQASEPLRDESGNFVLVKDGQKVAIPEAALQPMLDQGYEHVYGEAAAAAPATPSVPEPGADDPIRFKLNAVPVAVPMPWKDTKRLFLSGEGDYPEDEPDAEAWRQFARIGGDAGVPTAADAAADPTPPGGATGDLDPALTTQVGDEWTHPALPKNYKTKGAVTQALNKLAKEGGAQAAPTNGGAAATTPAPTSAAPSAGGATPAKLQEAQQLLAGMPQVAGDFKVLLALFDEVAGKRNIMEFNDGELDQLINKLNEMKAAA